MCECGNYGEFEYNGEWFCEHCQKQWFDICYECEEYAPRNEMLTVEQENYCSSCYGDKFIECHECGKPSEDVKEKDGYDYCERCYGELFATCTGCDDEFDKDEMKKHEGKWYCEECHEQEFTRCASCREVVSKEDSYMGDDDREYCEDCFNEEFYYCHDCEETIHRNRAVEIEHNRNNYYVCHSCFVNGNYFRCDDCGDNFEINTCYGDEYASYCESCADNYTRCEGCECLVDNPIRINGSYYCESCSENRHENGIHRHDYEPTLRFLPAKEFNRLYFGVEWEIDEGGESDDKADNLKEICDDIYIKTDGSLNNGLEVVTHPATLAYHMEEMNWERLCKAGLRMGYRSHDTETCGLHIHMSRDAFGGEENVLKLVYLFEKFWSQIVRFSRRKEHKINQWASRYFGDSVEQLKNTVKNQGRYKAVNLENWATVEVRVFRGSMNPETIFASIQFMQHCFDAVTTLSTTKLESLTWDEFTRNIEYPELISYLKRRKLYVEPQIRIFAENDVIEEDNSDEAYENVG